MVYLSTAAHELKCKVTVFEDHRSTYKARATTIIIELAADTVCVNLGISAPMELVLTWIKVNGSCQKMFLLKEHDSVRMLYWKSDRVVETYKHFIELHIKKPGSGETYFYTDSLYKPVVYHCEYLGKVNM